jgi:Uma2 family endonuclease
MMATPLGRYDAPVTYEQFLREYEGSYAEYVDGVIHPMNPPGTRHQRIVGFLGALFTVACEETESGDVLIAPTQMRIGTSGREPDVQVIRNGSTSEIRATHVDGPADLVIEVISPDSGRRDRIEKLAEYDQRGVGEYWIIDPFRESVEVHRRDAGGRFQPADLGSPPRLTTDVVPHVSLDPAWLWQEPLPKLMWVLDQWGLR